VKWNAKSILSLFCLKRSPLVCSFVSCYFIPAFSCPAHWSVNFTSVIFTSSIFSAPLMSTYFTAADLLAYLLWDDHDQRWWVR